MPLPISWVDHLFAKLAIRYGDAFPRQWRDSDPALVKADWAEVLDGTSGGSMSYALRYLPNTPPNAMQFRALCRAAPRPDVPALAAPDVRADPDRVRAIVARLKAPSGSEGLAPAEKCARNILRIVSGNGGRVSFAQRHQLEAMAHLLQPETRALAARYVPTIQVADEVTA